MSRSRTGDQIRFTAALIIVQSRTTPVVVRAPVGPNTGFVKPPTKNPPRREVDLVVGELEARTQLRGPVVQEGRDRAPLPGQGHFVQQRVEDALGRVEAEAAVRSREAAAGSRAAAEHPGAADDAVETAASIGRLQVQEVARGDHRQVDLHAGLDAVTVLGVRTEAGEVRAGKEVAGRDRVADHRDLVDETGELCRTPRLIDPNRRDDVGHRVALPLADEGAVDRQPGDRVEDLDAASAAANSVAPLTSAAPPRLVTTGKRRSTG